jgi:hypothetical protein
MGRIFGDGSETSDPNEELKKAQEREAQADGMKPENKTTLEVWHKGQKYSMPYTEFVAKYGDPRDYTTQSLIKTIVSHDLKKSMGI